MAAENLKRGLSVIDPTLQKMGYMLRMILSSGTLYDNYMTPRNFSPTAKEQFSRSDPDVGTGFVRSRRTMHWIKMQIKVDQDSRKIVDVSYLPFGCPSVTACSSIASAWIKGKKIEQALEFKNSGSGSQVDGVRRGQLCYLDPDDYGLHVWAMKEYGVKESWTKLFSLDKSKLITNGFPMENVIALYESRDGRKTVLFMCSTRKSLIWYDIEHGSTQVVEVKVVDWDEDIL